MFGMSLIDLAVGFLAGGLVCAGIPAVFAWFSKQEKSAAARVTTLEAQVAALIKAKGL
jgi:hypothetical protein